jgi:hypothetical protein
VGPWAEGGANEGGVLVDTDERMMIAGDMMRGMCHSLSHVAQIMTPSHISLLGD